MEGSNTNFGSQPPPYRRRRNRYTNTSEDVNMSLISNLNISFPVDGVLVVQDELTQQTTTKLFHGDTWLNLNWSVGILRVKNCMAHYQTIYTFNPDSEVWTKIVNSDDSIRVEVKVTNPETTQQPQPMPHQVPVTVSALDGPPVSGYTFPTHHTDTHQASHQSHTPRQIPRWNTRHRQPALQPPTSSQQQASALQVICMTTNEIDQECSICMENYHVGENASKTPCDHMFHAKCLDQWMQQRRWNSAATCPLCRTELPA